MAFFIPPPPSQQKLDSWQWRDWFYRLQQKFTSIVWGISNGGTGTSQVPANGELLIGNGTDYSVNTLTAGSNISIVNGEGSIVISAVIPQYVGDDYREDGGDTYIINPPVVASGGGSGLTHPEVLTRVSFRI